MLNEICGYLRNYFVVQKVVGSFVIEDGKITGRHVPEDAFIEGQYIRIVGSILNDGVYLYNKDGIEGLHDEFFDGAIWGLAIPKEIVQIAEEIKAWTEKNGGVDSTAMSPYSSESFGGYSYSKGSTNDNNGGYMAGDWKSVYASRLAQWRKI